MTTYQVHHYIFMESCPPLRCHITHIHYSFGVISVDMEYGGVDHTGYVGGVWRGTCHTGICCETNLGKENIRDHLTLVPLHVGLCAYLVVDHHVHSAMCGVGRQIAQMAGFVDDALTCKCSITMKKDRHHLQQRQSNKI